MDLLKGQQLLRGSRVESADEALSDKQVILFYFSAHWCPPCRIFTPILNDFYSELIREDEPLEVVFVSSDSSPEEMATYVRESHADWLAVQHGAALACELKKKYRVTGLPSLIAVSRPGQLISKSGRIEVTERGADVFREWLASARTARTREKNEKLNSHLSHNFEGESVRKCCCSTKYVFVARGIISSRRFGQSSSSSS